MSATRSGLNLQIIKETVGGIIAVAGPARTIAQDDLCHYFGPHPETSVRLA
jgi:hypothetical protein